MFLFLKGSKSVDSLEYWGALPAFFRKTEGMDVVSSFIFEFLSFEFLSFEFLSFGFLSFWVFEFWVLVVCCLLSLFFFSVTI